MKRENDFDTPILAVLKTLEQFRGQVVGLGEFRDAFRFNGGGSGSLEGALDIVERTKPGRFRLDYIRNPGWYTDVLIEVFDRFPDDDKK